MRIRCNLCAFGITQLVFVPAMEASQMCGVNLGELFPSHGSLVVFISYMALFILQGLLVRGSQSGTSSYNYNTMTAVLFTECLKLLTAFLILIKQTGFKAVFQDFRTHISVGVYYFIPSLLYCIYNNLMYVNLKEYDPTTYFLLLQLRVVVTGIIYQVLFQRKLSKIQWVSLLLITVGCMVKESGRNWDNSKDFTFTISLNFGLILVQVFCSCFAGVYNEFLLKDKGKDLPLMLQNIYMYVASILCNLVAIMYMGHAEVALGKEALMSILQVLVVILMVNNAAIGIVTSLFLKHLNSILKAIASALELMFTAVLSFLFFGIPIDSFMVIGIALVSYGTVLYAQHPVAYAPPSKTPEVNDTDVKSESIV